jgi:two-component system nitrate/nitrite response regulator NarL
MIQTPIDTIRVLIADDHQLVRDLVSLHLTAQGGTTVRTAETLGDALNAVEEEGAFDVVLLDLAMPGMNGLKGLTDMIEANKDKPVLLFSGQAQRETVEKALELGAAGFVPKNMPAKSLMNAIRFVVAGETFLPASYLSEASTAAVVAETGLSPKEIVVLRGIRAGLMNKEIASQMKMSEVTIKMYVRSICTKLNARNRTHAAMLAGSLALN